MGLNVDFLFLPEALSAHPQNDIRCVLWNFEALEAMAKAAKVKSLGELGLSGDEDDLDGEIDEAELFETSEGIKTLDALFRAVRAVGPGKGTPAKDAVRGRSRGGGEP